MTHQSAWCTHTAPQRMPPPLSRSSAAVQSQNRSAQRQAALYSNTGVSCLLAVEGTGSLPLVDRKLVLMLKATGLNIASFSTAAFTACLQGMLCCIHSTLAMQCSVTDSQQTPGKTNRAVCSAAQTSRASKQHLTPAYISYGSRYLRSQIP